MTQPHVSPSRARQPARALQEVIDPAGWTKDDLAASDDWIYALNESEIADLDRAVAAVERAGTQLMDVERSGFELPVLGPALRSLRAEVIEGRGFALLRGVPVHRYSRLQSAIAYWGIGRYFGDPLSQNAKGHLLGHVKDLGDKSLNNPTDRGYQTLDRLPFHIDPCDVVGLLCLQPAKSGGESTITSSITIHNEMLRRDPALVAALSERVYRDRRGEVPAGSLPYYQMPVFNYHEGYLTTSWQGGYIRSTQRFEDVPRHSATLTAALDTFDELARDLSFAMDFRQGDIQLLHNHVIVHSRREFENHDDPALHRHLLRLWLVDPAGRPLPPAMFDRYPHMKPGQRPLGGIVVPGTVLKTPLEAE